MSDNLSNLIESVKAQKTQALAKLLSALETDPVGALEHQELLNPVHQSLRIGVTGPPGAGKSTLIGQMIKEFRKKGLTVGVLAVDPSSPFTKGAILGDRIRYSEHFSDEGVFIRSIGSRGSLGGLSGAAYMMLRAFDLYQFDIVLIETVGVGQTELEIVNVADLVGVVLVPESGDSIQAMKAGLLEIANIFVVNKADRPGAEAMEKELKASIELGHRNKNVEVIKTIASEGEGVSSLVDFMVEYRKTADLKQLRSSVTRLRWEAAALLRSQFEVEIEKLTASVQNPTDLLTALEQNKLINK